MKWNDKQTPTPQRPQLPEQPQPNNKVVIEENEEDPMLTEGYLPEIYFSLKSDNPADW